MFYGSNFEDQAYKSSNPREFNKLRDDPCALQQTDGDNKKKLKFVTTNHADLLQAKEEHNFFGIGVRDKLSVPGNSIDVYSNLLNGQNGGQLTNCNVRNGFGQLPFPTLPSKYQLSRGDVDVEDSIRNLIESNRQSCNPREDNFFQRHFYLFDDAKGIETPNATKSLEPDAFGKRGGMSTRFAKHS